MPPETYQPRHSGGWHNSGDRDRDAYSPRHGEDVYLIETVESVTGLNGRTLIRALRAERLTIAYVGTVAA